MHAPFGKIAFTSISFKQEEVEEFFTIFFVNSATFNILMVTYFQIIVFPKRVSLLAKLLEIW